METTTILNNVSAEQIKNLFKGLENQLKELKENFEPKVPSEYLTRNEVAEMLKVDLSTLWNWQKKGKLIPVGLGNRVYYKRSDIEAALITLGKLEGPKNA
jgi:predicted DNA-binding transcriptional regulator AlpA